MLEDLLGYFLEIDEYGQDALKKRLSGGFLHILSKTPGGIFVQQQVDERCIAIGQYIADTGATVRAAARRFGVSKSSVHKEMNQRLPALSPALAAQVRAVLIYNKAVRHLRGGDATRRKYRSGSSAGP